MKADADAVGLNGASKLAVFSSELRDFEEGVPMRFLVLDKGLLAAVDDFVLLEDSVKRVRINRHEMRLDVADRNDVEPFLVVLLVKSVQDDVVPKQWDQTVRRAQPTLLMRSPALRFKTLRCSAIALWIIGRIGKYFRLSLWGSVAIGYPQIPRNKNIRSQSERP